MSAAVEATTDAMTAPPALEVRGLRGGYGSTTVLRDIDLTVPRGSVAAIIGPNGAGKTTLLKTIAGVLRPSHGSIVMGGQDVTGMSAAKRHRLGACTIPEGRGVFRSLTVRENLQLQVPRGEEKRATELAVEAFPSLGRRMTYAAGTLSGGEQQMLAMAQAYVKQPKLVLVDEASLGLAPLMVDEIFAFLKRVTEQGVSLLVVDQFVTRVLDMADIAFVLSRGEVTYAGSPAELAAGGIFQEYLGLHGETAEQPGKPS